MQILVARQSVSDRRGHIYAYDLVLQRPGQAAGDGDVFPEQLVADTFLGIGINQVSGGHRAMITVNRTMLLSGAAQLLPATRVVLHLAENPGKDLELFAACEV